MHKRIYMHCPNEKVTRWVEASALHVSRSHPIHHGGKFVDSTLSVYTDDEGMEISREVRCIPPVT